MLLCVCLLHFFSNISATNQQLQQQQQLQQSDQFAQHLASVHVHARTDLACTVHSYIVHERIFLKFEILLCNNNTNTLTSMRATFGMCVHARISLACTASISGIYEWIFLKFEILFSDN